MAVLKSQTNIICCLLVHLSFVLTGGACRADGPPPREYLLKAAFIYNFAKFVQWPARSFTAADSPIIIGVYGSNPFGNALVDTVKGRRINGRQILVKAVNSAAAAKGTHLLFVSTREVASFSSVKNSIGPGILVVGESQSISNQGATIIFNLVGDKLRFEINMAVADRSGLKISAQLQKLASAIRR